MSCAPFLISWSFTGNRYRSVFCESSSHSITSMNCELGLSRSSIPIFRPHSEQDSNRERLYRLPLFNDNQRSQATGHVDETVENRGGSGGNKTLVILVDQRINHNQNRTNQKPVTADRRPR